MRHLPSVTETINPWVDFSRIAPGTLHAAADRGTAVHDVCLNFHVKNIPFVGKLPDGADGYIESFDRWYEAVVAEAILVEGRLFDDANGYSGQIDLLVKTTHGETWLCDLKTPAQLAKSWRLQIAAYRHLCELNNYKIDCAGSLRLHSDGGTPKMEWYKESGGRDFSIFLSALNCFRYFNS
jgi:hypothetical protein